MEYADNLAWLEWFYINSDFGPADFDVRYILMERFEKETEKMVPKGWRIGFLEDEE